ncbi:1,4-alpha-glucan branching enzyme [Lewinella aquimaris]|uniref:1,4-alpha-glucan branching enzyme n=1 Tax=Neolewinella aquimaris TaxID=1835722 RepID=A0A840E297_9BACT|nr:alpha-amylase family glycosyl hydrolase [Neolewinella aquimaris]MBB4079220.1 1,4-alpha-glucan branching enzyme [Neolewinella aquimaris]
MPRILLCTLLFSFSVLQAQIVTTDPAVPVAGQALTITYDATQGTAGLRDCNCDIYLHTGVITPASTHSGDWKFVKTEWGKAEPDWKLTPVAGEANKYTYTFTPTVRQYYGVPEETEIQKIALVFRDATGDREGKAAGGTDIFIDVSSGSALDLNLLGDPGTDTYALGKPLPITVGTTADATISLFDNDSLVATATGTQLTHDLRLLSPGQHTVRVEAKSGDQVVADSFSVEAVLVLEITSPVNSPVSATVGDRFTIAANSFITSELRITTGGEVVSQVNASEISTEVVLPDAAVTTYTVTATYQGETTRAAVTFVTGPPAIAAVPEGLSPGATLLEDGGVSFLLRAPGKTDVFIVGNFNNWSPTAGSRMNRSPDGTSFWLTIPEEDLPCQPLLCDSDLLYQYAIDDQGRFADPYSTLVLDPQNDPFITDVTFADIPSYPTDETEGIVSWVRLFPPDYDWQVDEFERPDPEKMVVYELLVRDFLASHSYRELTDTLDYLDRLGINTIELMPVSEFEGNISWGYNVSFHMALDKYYGTPEDLKAFVDAAHARGIAVVLDVVYNHAFGQSPLIRMWPGTQPYEPGADNPYANVTARHPFNVGYDLNHESTLTREYVKTTLAYWLEEFRIDGFRFDLSKGFTQNFSNDVDVWNEYDASRIAILKEYADLVWSVNDEAYVIMEHLGESREENELAQYGNGMYFWSGYQPHDAYLEASMGYNEGSKSNFSDVLAVNRGFDQRSLVAYMESHDEERMVYKNREFGNSSGNYSVKDLPTALERAELASAFFYTLPGPKMLWQFGELGYDYPINYCADGRVDNSCRTDPKPIVWEYRDNADRQEVYHTIADLLYLRNNYDYFHGNVTASNFNGAVKYVHLDSDDGRAAIIGNFGVTGAQVTNAVPTTGTWYDYFNGESVTFSDLSAGIDLGPGEYRVYLSQEVERKGGRLSTATNDAAVARLFFSVFPNPTSGTLHTTFTLERSSEVNVVLMDLLGRPVHQLFSGALSAGDHRLDTTLSVPAGSYFLRITDGSTSAVRPLVVR